MERDAKLVSPAMAEGSQTYRTIRLRHSLNNLLQLKTKPVLCQTSVRWIHQFGKKKPSGDILSTSLWFWFLRADPQPFWGANISEGWLLWFPMMLPGIRAAFCVSVCWAPYPCCLQIASIHCRGGVLGESRAPEAGQWRSAECLLEAGHGCHWRGHLSKVISLICV